MGDGELDDDPGGRLLPPEDRLWRHPSEFQQSPTGPGSRNGMAIVIAALGGALLASALWMTFGGSAEVRLATERVALIPVQSVAPRITPADEWTRVVADIARPSTAAVRLIDGSTIVAGAVAIRDDGYLITSGRAIDGAMRVIVVSAAGDVSEAIVIGRDFATDVAVLKIDQHMTPAVISDSGPPAVGDTVAVVDPVRAPENRTVLDPASTSADADGNLLIGVIELGGTINGVLPGSPAVDETGAVVGMVASTAPNAPTAVVPIDLARSVTHELVDTGSVRHPKAGITARDVRPSDDTGTVTGAIVTSVQPNGPAADSGMLVGDVVVKVDDTGIDTMAEMVARIMSHDPGDTVEFLVIRYGNEVTCRVTLRAAADPAD